MRFVANLLVILAALELATVVHGQVDQRELSWPQAAGPNHNYQVLGKAPDHFSVSQNQNIAWRTPLPNTGESTPIIAGDRIYLSCHTPMSEDRQSGRDILGMCFDARTGKELWRRTLPASRVTDMASGFSDNTAASPVSDGNFVCFINVGGSIRTFDKEGNLVWEYDWVPFGRHHARQQEPILYNGRVIMLKTVAENLPESATTKAGAKPLGRGVDVWTRLHAFDLATGQVDWIAQSATSVHCNSMLGFCANGQAALLTGRGGGHQPPEEPYGLSLIDAETGETIWDLPIKGYAAHQNATWNQENVPAFVGMQQHVFRTDNAQSKQALSLIEDVSLRRFQGDNYVQDFNYAFSKKRNKSLTYQSNILIGDYHYFRAHNERFLGRVNLIDGQVEYLQVPVQVVRSGESGSRAAVVRWAKALENDVRNHDGFIACQDDRAKLDGWGHVSAASPIAVGNRLYVPTMLGIVYVVRWDADNLTEDALLSISDLGPAGKTWSLSSLSYDRGKIYARTMKELICISGE